MRAVAIALACAGLLALPRSSAFSPSLAPNARPLTSLASALRSAVRPHGLARRGLELGSGVAGGRGRREAAGGLRMVHPLAEATLSAASGLLPNPIVRDVVCSGTASVLAFFWVAFWILLARTGAVESKVSRKVVHCGSGPLFLLVWPLYSQTAWTPLVAGLVPLVNAVRLFKAGTASEEGGKDAGLVNALSRSGQSNEVLQGPFVYTLVLLFSTLLGWGSMPAIIAAIAAICQMAGGDGMADLVGRKFGTVKWPWSRNKSVIGTVAFFLAAFLSMSGEIAWYHAFGLLEVTATGAASRVALISAACAIVELVPLYKFFGIFGDDNLSVPITAATLAYFLF